MEIKKSEIVLIIKGQEVILNPKECIELRDLLCEQFPVFGLNNDSFLDTNAVKIV